jgi:hypothetical protein
VRLLIRAFWISARLAPLGRPINARIFAPLLSARGALVSLALAGSRYSTLNSSISRAAISAEVVRHAFADSSCSRSTKMVLGRADQAPSSTLEKSVSFPGAKTL